MAVDEQPIEKLKKAYRVLDVPATASALAIKSNYRKLIKRWHPDRPMTGGSMAAEATLMTKLINEAFALIQNAPLRYYAGRNAPGSFKQNVAPERKSIDEVDLPRMFFNEKRIEYAVRIACGAISGAFVGLAFSVDIFREDIEIVVAIILCAIGFAAGAVKYGDRFWRMVFGNWWMWR
jgi:DnaJ domain